MVLPSYPCAPSEVRHTPPPRKVFPPLPAPLLGWVVGSVSSGSHLVCLIEMPSGDVEWDLEAHCFPKGRAWAKGDAFAIGFVRDAQGLIWASGEVVPAENRPGADLPGRLEDIRRKFNERMVIFAKPFLIWSDGPLV